MKEYVEHKHIGNAIHICGKTDRIDDVYADADIFCMPSRDEGFPLALTEAMAAGLPAVGFNDSTGVNDIIENEINGYLVARSTLDLSKALKKLMQNSQLREEMGTHGIRSMQQYEPNRIWNQWEDVIAEVAEKDWRNINQINH